MIRFIRALGVFTVVTLGVFLASSIVHSGSIREFFSSFHVAWGGALVPTRAVFVHVLAWLAYLAWIFRVYFQFVGVELSPYMQSHTLPLIERVSPVRATAEVGFRLLLVLGVSLFPQLCAWTDSLRAMGHMTIAAYFAGLSFLLVVWDFGVYAFVARGMTMRAADRIAAYSARLWACLIWRTGDIVICVLFSTIAVTRMLGVSGNLEFELTVSAVCLLSTTLILQLAWGAQQTVEALGGIVARAERIHHRATVTVHGFSVRRAGGRGRAGR